ncbi:ISL3 family transposase [Rhodocytophaga aerolata]|uniref:ISL3 family transposase n=1 Tax=Rhodocytophaga aerolata TaxID=455078 RepID=UPI00361885C4
MTSGHPVAHCPLCLSSSQRIHSRYSRKVADLPWADKRVLMHLTVRRFFCDLADCKRNVFCERLHPAIAAYARKTTRLAHYLQNLALQLGGERTALLLELLNIHLVSADTLLNLSRKVAIATASAPKIVGIDEWAIRKGQTYATILVDLQTHRPIDLLPDAKLETVESWFKEHPGIAIVSRDRDTTFAEAARKGAPSAIQIADWWHLLQNLGDALKRMLEMNAGGLHATAVAMTDIEKQEKEKNREQALQKQMVVQEEPVGKSQVLHKQVKELYSEGWSMRKIAKHLQISRQTVKRYSLLEKVPKKRYSQASTRRLLTNEQIVYLAKRWAEGDVNAKQLWKELKQEGYQGAPASIYRAVAYFPPRASAPIDEEMLKKAIPPVSARSAMWLMMKGKEKLSDRKQQLLAFLLTHHEQARMAYPIAQQFIDMVKNRKAAELDTWLIQAKESGIAQLRQFAGGVQRDYQAVHAALSMEWSNGQVEGQINRLKLIKRQGYGRAKLELLKKRVLYRLTKQAA